LPPKKNINIILSIIIRVFAEKNTSYFRHPVIHIEKGRKKNTNIKVYIIIRILQINEMARGNELYGNVSR